jgi:hypothetical protein
LDQDTVEDLIRTGRLEGALWRDEERTRPFGIFDDVLPSRKALAAMDFPLVTTTSRMHSAPTK